MKSRKNSGFSDKRVLIMEDDLILTLSLELMLKRAGVGKISRVRTGEDAMALVASTMFDLIIADIYLGKGILGTDAVYQIQKKKEIPVIYITGNSDNQNRSDAERTIHIDYLVKPITSDQLYESLVKAWDRGISVTETKTAPGETYP